MSEDLFRSRETNASKPSRERTLRRDAGTVCRLGKNRWLAGSYLLPIVLLCPDWGLAQRLPTLPLPVDTTMPAITGNTYTVNAGGNLQTALNQASRANPSLNHEIIIQAGASFTGPFSLPPGPPEADGSSSDPPPLPASRKRGHE
jgi:hypothetical protein